MLIFFGITLANSFKKNPPTMSDRAVLPTNVTPVHYGLHIHPVFEDLTFSGTTTINLKVNDPSVDTITLNSVDLEWSSVNIVAVEEGVALSEGAKQVEPTKLEFNEEAQTATMHFPKGYLASSNLHRLTIAYKALLNSQMAGFYKAKYTDKATGETKYMATTQMEATDARRAFPCFDEPNLKAPFAISLKSTPEYEHLSNSHIVDVKVEGPYKTTTFEDTPPMSTYLVAFIVSELKSVSNKTGRVPVTVWATPGNEQEGQFAADLAAQTIDFFEDTFKIAYPLKKMDMVAVHEFSAGAMENWGLVTYRMVDVLIDPKKASLDRIQRVAEVIQHELAHQWFGNLVTMDWWEGLWLNEGFATWMSWYSCNNFHPEWKVWEQYVADNLQRAIGLDSLRSSHPIEVPVKNADEINQIFDAISYSKGSSLLRMTAQWLGEDVFIKGVSSYLQEFAFKNAKTEDLWNHLSKASGKDVNKVMNIWTGKVGFPLLTVIEGPKKLTFVQHRYLSTGDVLPEEDETTYPVFLSIKTKNGVDNTLVLDEKIKSFDIDYADFYKVNNNQAGLFITAYPVKRWNTFGKQRKMLSVEDRTGLVADAKNLCSAGYIATPTFLNLVSDWKDEDSFVVWEQICNSLMSMQKAWLFEDDKVQEAYTKYLRSIIEKKVENMNWTFKESDSYDDQRLKVVLFRTAGAATLPSITKIAIEMFEKYITGTSSAIPVLLKGVIFAVVAREGGVENYNKMFDLYKNSDNSDERLIALRSLGKFPEAELMQRTLGYVLDGTVLNQDIYTPLIEMRSTKAGVLALWEWVEKNIDVVIERLHPSSPLLGHLLTVTVSGFTTYQDISKVKAFFDKRDTKGYNNSLAQAIDTIEAKAQWVQRDAEEVEQFLKDSKFLA